MSDAASWSERSKPRCVNTMSSSGHYQSQVFKFLSQQRLRLKDRYERSIRSFSLLMSWGVQIALYPIYVVFQSVRLTGRQIGQRLRRATLRLQAASQGMQALMNRGSSQMPPSVDRPLRRSLQTVQTFALPRSPQIRPASLEATDRADADHADAPQILGIATQLADRQLVLVTDNQQIFDGLTPHQRDRLTQTIAWEVAGFYRHQKLLRANHAALARSSSVGRLPLPSDRKHQLWPIQVFYRVMGWMQTCQVAIAVNLFQEATHLGSVSNRVSDQLSHPLAHPLALPETLSQSRLALFPTQLGRFSLPSMGRSRQRSSTRPNSQSAGEGQWFDPDLHQLDYAALQFAASPEAIPRDAALSMTEQDSGLMRPERMQQQPDARSLPPVLAQDWASSPRLVRGDGASSFSASPSQNLQPHDLMTAEVQPSEADALPIWIETKATLVGYVKHPLEQVLEWLDHGMLWIETLMDKAWNWLKRNI